MENEIVSTTTATRTPAPRTPAVPASLKLVPAPVEVGIYCNKFNPLDLPETEVVCSYQAWVGCGKVVYLDQNGEII